MTIKPRSGGEVLGCTAPTINEKSGNILFICDGRFHMEGLMIANPLTPRKFSVISI